MCLFDPLLAYSAGLCLTIFGHNPRCRQACPFLLTLCPGLDPIAIGMREGVDRGRGGWCTIEREQRRTAGSPQGILAPPVAERHRPRRDFSATCGGGARAAVGSASQKAPAAASSTSQLVRARQSLHIELCRLDVECVMSCGRCAGAERTDPGILRAAFGLIHI